MLRNTGFQLLCVGTALTLRDLPLLLRDNFTLTSTHDFYVIVCGTNLTRSFHGWTAFRYFLLRFLKTHTVEVPIFASPSLVVSLHTKASHLSSWRQPEVSVCTLLHFCLAECSWKV